MNDIFKQTTQIAKVKKQYAIYDRARHAFLSLMEKPNDRCALRDFEAMCNKVECMLSQCPEDYALYIIGEFNEELGSFEANLSKIAEATDYCQNYTPKPQTLKKGKTNVRKKS